MKIGICKDTCYSDQLYVSGKEYMVDETHPFFKKHFVFEEEITQGPEIPEATEKPDEEIPHRGRPKK
jgi:hypothetical protein